MDVAAEQHLDRVSHGGKDRLQCSTSHAHTWTTHTQHAPSERLRSAPRCPRFVCQPPVACDARRLRLAPGCRRRIQTCGRGAVACGCVWCASLLLAVPGTRALTRRRAARFVFPTAPRTTPAGRAQAALRVQLRTVWSARPVAPRAGVSAAATGAHPVHRTRTRRHLAAPTDYGLLLLCLLSCPSRRRSDYGQRQAARTDLSL